MTDPIRFNDEDLRPLGMDATDHQRRSRERRVRRYVREVWRNWETAHAHDREWLRRLCLKNLVVARSPHPERWSRDDLMDELLGIPLSQMEGTLWINIGDSYIGSSGGSDGNHAGLNRWRSGGRTACKRAEGLKPKNLAGVPWRLAFKLQERGWFLRADCIWHKPAPMPEGVFDRPTRSHEYVFLLTRSSSYYYDADAVRRPLAAKTLTTYGATRKAMSKGRNSRSNRLGQTMPVRAPRVNDDGELAGANLRTVWTVASEPQAGRHTAAYPRALIEPCIRAGCPPGGVVLDPYAGSGTTGIVAMREKRRFLGVELNPEYAALAGKRIREAEGTHPSRLTIGGRPAQQGALFDQVGSDPSGG